MSGLSVELANLSKTYESAGPRGRDVPAVASVNLGIRSGEFFTLLGPSGCGKTTILRLIAGLLQPTAGEVFIEGRPLSGVPAYRRPVNMVFQDYALFPHLTVAQNVGFGLTVRRVPRGERERRVNEMLELVQLPDVGDRRPGHLSGGQQQRIALARALINDPAVLLLDEPLGALDLKLRKQMQMELKHLQQQVGITFVYVTHDQEEALAMSDRIAIMCDGQLLQIGDPVTVYEKPATRFVAGFVGESNFLEARVVSSGAQETTLAVGGEPVLAETDGTMLYADQRVMVTVRPEKLVLDRPTASPEHALAGVVHEIVYIGTDTRFVIGLASGQQVVARLQNIGGHGLGEFAPGDKVHVSWAAHDARILTA